ncbi:MAG: hypothetical protein GC162_13125 [Planctomycetes bacterium]|nr:hypothetical protein [Planctomycetota bacterium]
MVRWINGLWMSAGALLVICITGCAQRTNRSSAEAYYDHAYPAARDAVRQLATDRKSTDIVLDNMRLGMASLADGDLDESERALLRAYEYLRSGGVNTDDRTIASEYFFEGVKVWKGEPFEQAMSYYYISALYMLKGDWENARAAASNSLFALRDFAGSPENMEQLARTAAEHDQQRGGDYLKTGYKAIESQFALGYLMAATAYVQMKQPADAKPLFDRVRELRADLAPLADALEGGQYDTLLLVDVGRGPRKQAYGEDDAMVRFVPDGRQFAQPLAAVFIDGRAQPLVGQKPVVDLWTLSQSPRWWSLEEMRKARSAIGNVLLMGGLAATAIGSNAHSREATYAGLGAAALGMLMKSGSKADTRQLEMLPHCVFMVPVMLGTGRHEIGVQFQNESGCDAAWHEITGGSVGNPAVYYLRQHNGNGAGMPPWAGKPRYSADVLDYQPGHLPYILGGDDVTPPSAALIDAYHKAGVLTNLSLTDLTALYQSEGIVFRPGPQGRDDTTGLDPIYYRHITARGLVLFTPRPGTHGYERITRLPHDPYQPRHDEVKRIMSQLANPAPAQAYK